MNKSLFAALFLPLVLVAQQKKDSLTESKIEGVVLTGFQKIEKSKLTSSTEKVKLNAIEQKATASVDQMLTGKVAGVMITPSSGTPGQIAPMRIRGTASLSGPVSPLWVIDGVPLEGNEAPDFKAGQEINILKSYSIAGINSDDIEDITILKDASATAIYGARAANGVILVTTKNGKKGRMNFNLSSSTFVNLRPDFNQLHLMNSNQKLDFELMMAGREDLDEYRKNNGAISRLFNQYDAWDVYRTSGYDALNPELKNAIQSLRNTNTNWGKHLYRNAVNHQHTFSLSGGADAVNYYASLGYYNEDATVIGDGFNRLNLTFKNNYRVNKNISIGLSVFGTNTKRTSFLTDSGSYTSPVFYSRHANPYLTAFDAQGNYVYDPDINYVERLNGDEIRIPYNFIEERDHTRYSLNSQNLKSIVDFSYKIIKGLEFRSQFGLQLDNNKTEKYASQDTYFLRKRRENSRTNSGTDYVIPTGDYFYTVNENGIDYNFKNILEYSKIFNNKHDVTLLAGSEIRKTKYNGVITQQYGYNPNTKTSVPLVIPDTDFDNEIYRPVKDYETINTYASFFGTASYTFDRRYTLFGSLRYDGTNLFGAETNKKWNPIWAISAAWNVKNEAFLKESNTISMLKLRGSYGIQGNIDRNTSPFFIGKYNTVKILNQTESNINAEGAPNALLRWEKTATKDLGIDLGLFKNRINITADVYHRKGTDILGSKELPYESGFSVMPINWASITNKGFEFSLYTKNIDKENFKWNTNFNISANRSNIDKVEAGKSPFLPSGEGYPVNAIFGIQTAGLDKDGVPQFYDAGGKIVSAEEFYKLTDPWADFFPGYMVETSLKEADFRKLFSYLGDRDPKFYGGITNNFIIRNWDFAVAASFYLKQSVMANPLYNFTAVDRGLNTSADILTSWSPQNTNSLSPRILGRNTIPGREMVYNWFSNADTSSSYNYFSNLVKEISYMRINSIKLGYNIPKTFLSNTGINQLKLYLEGRNLFVFGSNYDGYFDPETYGNIYAAPIQKSVVFGFNLNF